MHNYWTNIISDVWQVRSCKLINQKFLLHISMIIFIELDKWIFLNNIKIKYKDIFILIIKKIKKIYIFKSKQKKDDFWKDRNFMYYSIKYRDNKSTFSNALLFE